jgi:ribosomal protein S12 methylthiotransferase accessory factor
VDLSTVTDAVCRPLLDRYEIAGIDVACWDVSSDVDIPCFSCAICERESQQMTAFVSDGQGCHPVRTVALSRALTEAAQTRLTLIYGARDDLSRASYRSAQLSSTPAFAGEGVAFSAGTDWIAPTLREDVSWQLDRLGTAAINEVIVVDLRRNDLGVSVVRVIIPGLEGVSSEPGYVPGRRALRLLEQ